MKRYISILTPLLISVAVAGCEENEPGCCTTITAPAALTGSAKALASCGQNGAFLGIFCDDQSSDPQNLVVDENGVQFAAALNGTAQQFIKLGDLGARVIIDVTNGGSGVYTVEQNLIGKESGSSIASNSYSVTVASTSAIASLAVALGFVDPEDETAFVESLGRDPYGLEAVSAGLISVSDAKTMAEMVFLGKVN